MGNAGTATKIRGVCAPEAGEEQSSRSAGLAVGTGTFPLWAAVETWLSDVSHEKQDLSFPARLALALSPMLSSVPDPLEMLLVWCFPTFPGRLTAIQPSLK